MYAVALKLRFWWENAGLSSGMHCIACIITCTGYFTWQKCRQRAIMFPRQTHCCHFMNGAWSPAKAGHKSSKWGCGALFRAAARFTMTERCSRLSMVVYVCFNVGTAPPACPLNHSCHPNGTLLMQCTQCQWPLSPGEDEYVGPAGACSIAHVLPYHPSPLLPSHLALQ